MSGGVKRRRLDPRLAAAAEMVRAGSVAADIGTDHGYLIIELVASGKCPRGYACDIAPGPLSRAEKNIREAGFSDRIETLMGNGLDALGDRRADDVIILGMGGDVISSVLSQGGGKDASRRFILQPMTKAERLRRYLRLSGMAVTEEKAVVSGRFVYSVMSAVYDGKTREPDSLFDWTGLLLDNGDDASRLYLSRVVGRLKAASGNHAEAHAYERLARTIMERMI